jgi:hypothetical protein
MHCISPQIINTIGLIITMIGAIFIAVDVTRQYKGKKFIVSVGVPRKDYMGYDGTPIISGQSANETEEYKKWVKINYRLMLFGLIGILLGSIFQIIACWM